MLTRLHPQKDLDRFLNIAKMNGYTFVIAGDGPEYLHLIERISLEKIFNVSLIGYVSDKQSFFENIRLYLSTSKWEGLPYSVLEALSYKKPIVLSKVTGHTDFNNKGPQLHISQMRKQNFC